MTKSILDCHWQIRMALFGPTELFVLNFKGIQEELGKLFGAHGSVQEYWVSQKKTGGVASGSGLYGVVRHVSMLAPWWGLNFGQAHTEKAEGLILLRRT